MTEPRRKLSISVPELPWQRYVDAPPVENRDGLDLSQLAKDDLQRTADRSKLSVSGDSAKAMKNSPVGEAQTWAGTD